MFASGRISARSWNRILSKLGEVYPIKVMAKPAAGGFEHAWHARHRWDEKRKAWVARMNFGMVNGRMATVPMRFADAPAAWQSSFPAGKRPGPLERTMVPLDYGPEIALTWRQVGYGSQPISSSTNPDGSVQSSYEAVPPYYVRRGVLRADGEHSSKDLKNSRLLFASDLVLRLERPFLANLVQLQGTDFSVSAAPQPARREPARVVSMPRFSVPIANYSAADLLFQRYEDSPTDDLLLATVYALSPAVGALETSGIDASFSLETRQWAHYNLAHSPRRDFTPQPEARNLTLATGLGLGLGDALFNLILSTQQAYAASVLAMFNARDLRGMFWEV